MVQHLLNDYRKFHSTFQIDTFIVGQAGTPYGQYMQSLAELEVRYEALKLDVIKEMRLELELKDDPSEIDTMEINLKLDGLRRTMKDRMREFCKFHSLAVYFKEQFGEITEARREELECERWRHNFLCIAATEAMQYDKLTTTTLRKLHSFPPALRSELLIMVSLKKDDLIQWFTTYDGSLPDVPLIPMKEGWKLVNTGG